jgi:hypothetical protein
MQLAWEPISKYNIDTLYNFIEENEIINAIAESFTNKCGPS